VQFLVYYARQAAAMLIVDAHIHDSIRFHTRHAWMRSLYYSWSIPACLVFDDEQRFGPSTPLPEQNVGRYVTAYFYTASQAAVEVISIHIRFIVGLVASQMPNQRCPLPASTGSSLPSSSIILVSPGYLADAAPPTYLSVSEYGAVGAATS
jgi:hypothetical protein